MSKKLLILTSSGGGGLLQTANAKEQEIKELDPSIQVFQVDILHAWLGKWGGTFCSQFWNQSQKTGNVWALKLILHVFHPLYEKMFWPISFIGALYTLFKYDPDRLMDTQPLSTSPILYALRIFNWKNNKHLYLEKVLVDLATAEATHYFRSIKSLGVKSRSLLKVVTIPPLLEKGETHREFWWKHCRHPEELVVYEEPFVRTSFRKYRKKPRVEDAVLLKVRYTTDEELELMKQVFRRGHLEWILDEKEKQIFFQSLPADQVITILLGSQGVQKATFNYAKQFLELARTKKERTHLFLFRSVHTPHQNSLLTQLAKWVEEVQDYPPHFTIVPFGFQLDDVIAPLFHRSDITCTRSGGQTAMELLSVSTGDIWIHSEAKGKNVSQKELLKGIPGWEAATAVYLQKARNAKIVTPDTFVPYLMS